MKQYEYKFIQVPVAWNTQGIISRPPKAGSTFDACKDVIENEAANGWRFKQIVIPFCEGRGVGSAQCYQVIFEREISCGSKQRQAGQAPHPTHDTQGGHRHG